MGVALTNWSGDRAGAVAVAFEDGVSGVGLEQVVTSAQSAKVGNGRLSA